MVENYPTCLRVLVLAENAISPELQQQISDLLSEGEEDDDKEGEARGVGGISREKTTWLPHSSKDPYSSVLQSYYSATNSNPVIPHTGGY